MSRVLAWFFGLLAVVALTALTVWEAAPRIEADLSSRAEAALDAAGVPGMPVEVDGRDLVLTGVATPERHDLARRALASLEGVRAVRGDLEVRQPTEPRMDVVEEPDSLSALDSLVAAPIDLEDADSTASGQDQLQASGSDDTEVQAAEAALSDALAAGSISFASGTATLTPASREVLGAVASVLERYPRLVAEVQGHTDSEGNDGTNRRLSQRRADAVAAYLLEAGVPAPSLRAEGYGESEPIDTNDTPEGRSRNRRVVFALALR